MNEGAPKLKTEDKMEPFDSQGGKAVENKEAAVKELEAMDGKPSGQVYSKPQEDVFMKEEKRKLTLNNILGIFKKKEKEKIEKLKGIDQETDNKAKVLFSSHPGHKFHYNYLIQQERYNEARAYVKFWSSKNKAGWGEVHIGSYNEETDSFDNLSKKSPVTSIAR